MRLDSAGHEEGSSRPAKRQRISRACGPCRYAKLRCNGQQPICSTCAQLKKQCTYNPITKHRGLRPGYVRALELLWGLTFQELENVEPIVDELLSRVSKQDLAASSNRAEPDAAALPILERWKQSSVSRHLDELLEENDESNEEDATSQGESGPNGLQSVASPSWEVTKKPKGQHVHVPPSAAYNIGPPTHKSNLQHRQVEDLTERFPFPPQNFTSQLLQLFFSHGQSWLPILERHVILKTSFLAQRNASQPQSGNFAALRGVYAYATAVFGHFLDDETAREYAEEHHDTLYAQAYSTLPLDSELPIELGHIQCILLLSLIRFSSGNFRASWRLLRHTIMMLRELDTQGEQNFDRDALARAWLACFIIDTLASACLHSKPLLHFNDVRDWCRINENGIEEWQEWQPPRQYKSNNMSSTALSEIPTHSLSLLVLHARLLHVLNENLHHPTAFGLGMKNIFANWDQDLSKFMSREGLNLNILNESLNIARLPPSFVSLSAVYTFVSTFAASQSQESEEENQISTPRSGYSLLPHITSRKLGQECDIYARLPALQLLFHEWDLFGLEAISDKSLRPSTTTDPMPLVVEQGLIQSGLSTFGAGSESSTLAEKTQMLGYPGQNLHRLDSSVSTDMEYHQMASIGQTSDTSLPLFDAHMDTTNAPFLEFLDTLDDRSM